eukprot:CAMPEP_0194297880 /NCGR_PEP_ID=MMETSP0169-20130528/59857_1 /TAXON_ID=218684 /ORGANISM="Corethron pennatum, Strain L29A3" /LENGTH=40 /DNA_ID= /DNA_START= /DNA_END= /DNA_ORIENTATION=
MAEKKVMQMENYLGNNLDGSSDDSKNLKKVNRMELWLEGV